MDPVIPTTAPTGAVPDTADPLIAVLSVVITDLLRRYGPPELVVRVEALIPTVVLLFAVAARAAYDVLVLEGLSWETLGRGAAAGAAAVWGHAQLRSALKRAASGAQDQDPPADAAA